MPVTRRAMAVANKVQDARESDSDDEAPEVVSKESAKELALEQRRQEKEAVRQQAIAAKRKRKTADEEEATKPDADVPANEDEQHGDDNEEEEDEEAPALPDDVLSALATRDEEDKAEQELESALDRQRRKRAASMKKRTHIRDFGSVQVRTIDTLDASQRRELTASAAAFLDRKSAPHRARMNVLEGHASQFTKKQKTRMAGARS